MISDNSERAIRQSAKSVLKPLALILFAETVPLLLIAGSIEGFISPRTDLSQDVKYLVSGATLALLLMYLFVPRTWKDAKSDTTAAAGPASKPVVGAPEES